MNITVSSSTIMSLKSDLILKSNSAESVGSHNSSSSSSIPNMKRKENKIDPSRLDPSMMIPSSPTEDSTDVSFVTKGSYHSLPTLQLENTRRRSRSSKHHAGTSSNSRRLSSAHSSRRRDRPPTGRSSSGHPKHHRSVRRSHSDSAQSAETSSQTRQNSPYPTTGLDKSALVERLRRLSCHLAGSMVETLLQQMEREEQARHRYLKSVPSNKNIPLTEHEKLLLIKAQMMQLEAQKDESIANSERMMETLARFEFDLPKDGHIGMRVDSEEESGDDDDESSSSSCLSESHRQSVYDVMPLRGNDHHREGIDKGLPTRHRSNNSAGVSLASHVSKTTPMAAEQVVTKIGQTRLNRTLRKSPSVASDNASIVSGLSNNDGVQRTPTTDRSMPSRGSRTSLHSAPAYMMQQQQQQPMDVNLPDAAQSTSQQLPSYLEQDDILHCDSHKSAICLVDISGFTSLSRELNVEDLSKVRLKQRRTTQTD
jgi:hypothetical protein